MRISITPTGLVSNKQGNNYGVYGKNKYSNLKTNNKFVSFGSKAQLDSIYNRMIIELNNMFYGHRPFGFHSPDGYIEVLKKFDIVDLMSLQGESAVFTMKDPTCILKLSCTPYEEYIPEFHAPEVGRGVIVTDKKYPVINLMKKIDTNKFYWVMQKRGIMPVSEPDQNMLMRKVLAAGYKLQDIKYDQFAYFDGEPKFIDLGCVYKGEDKNSFHTSLMGVK